MVAVALLEKVKKSSRRPMPNAGGAVLLMAAKEKQTGPFSCCLQERAMWCPHAKIKERKNDDI